MNKKDSKKGYESNLSKLRKLVSSWDLIPGAPKDEFDGLNHKILSHLYQGANFDKINKVLESELSVTYGFFSDEFNAEEMTTEIMECWNLTDKKFE